MGTNLINAIQHRNGPNQRPPNSIYGNSGSNQKLISNHLICGFMGAIFGGVALTTYFNYTMKHGSQEPTLKIGVLGILSVVFGTCSLLVACALLLWLNRKKHDTAVAVCNQTSCPDFESENLVCPDESNVEMTENPPSYDLALIMPTTLKRPEDTHPPSYDNIDMV